MEYKDIVTKAAQVLSDRPLDEMHPEDAEIVFDIAKTAIDAVGQDIWEHGFYAGQQALNEGRPAVAYDPFFHV